jgi:hypothetical protein
MIETGMEVARSVGLDGLTNMATAIPLAWRSWQGTNHGGHNDGGMATVIHARQSD